MSDNLIDHLAMAITEGRKRVLSPREREIIERCTRQPESFGIDTAFDSFCQMMEGYNAVMERQHAEARSADELRTALCPYPVSDNWTVGRCIDDGNCGCGATARQSESFGFQSPEEEHLAFLSEREGE